MERRHYIDDLRWITLLVLIPYHAAQAWNTWDEPNYIMFSGSRAVSSIIVFFSPFFMPVLFVLAGVGTSFAFKKRSKKEYLAERAKKLLIPFAFGTLLLMPVMTYIADRYNYSYSGGFFRHYKVFFTKFTDLTGADGGFSVGQFWFLLYLFVISLTGVLLIPLLEKVLPKREKPVPLWLMLLLGAPLPLLSEVLSVGGKSLAEYLYLFLIGYFVFSDDRAVQKAEKYCPILLPVGIAASVLDVWLFLWSDTKHDLLNTAAKFAAEWVMIIALLGLAKKCFGFTGKVAGYFKSRSFLLYIYHFIWVVLAEFLLCKAFSQTAVLYSLTVLSAYIVTFICCEISIRIPLLCFLTGTKYKPKK